jgi:hypothetical protein
MELSQASRPWNFRKKVHVFLEKNQTHPLDCMVFAVCFCSHLQLVWYLLMMSQICCQLSPVSSCTDGQPPQLAALGHPNCAANKSHIVSPATRSKKLNENCEWQLTKH